MVFYSFCFEALLLWSGFGLELEVDEGGYVLAAEFDDELHDDYEQGKLCGPVGGDECF